MDRSEKLVENYLKNIGFRDVIYEPDGKVPPDFLADGRVAVEVRRLNENHDDGRGRGLQGLEEVAIPLWDSVKKYLINLGPVPAPKQSWFVFYGFSRPIPNWKTLRRELDSLLKPFMASLNPQPFEITLNSGISIRVFKAGSPKRTFFRPGGYSDEQSGGLVIPDIDANLMYCITEKTAKIASYRAKYSEWWLVLPDHIGYGLDDFDQKQFLDQIAVQPGGFDKIVLLDPQDASHAFEVWP